MNYGSKANKESIKAIAVVLVMFFGVAGILYASWTWAEFTYGDGTCAFSDCVKLK